MAVKIRFSRIGKKHRPYWRIVAIDSRKKRDGACLENLGTYDPLDGSLIQFRQDRISSWVDLGAECTPAVSRLMRLNQKNAVKA